MLEVSTAPSKTTKKRVKIAGRTEKDAVVKMFVNGADQGKTTVREGKISKWVVLNAIGSNEILVTAETGEGSRSATLNVTKQAKRAIDRPLGLEIIHSENATKSSIITIWGKADGVSQVQVEVDDFEWGWAVVKKVSGKYNMKVRLNEGLNTIKVTGEKDGEYVTVTKVVEKE